MPALPLLIAPEALLPHLGDADLLIIDAGAHYPQAHLPGATHLPPQALVAGTHPAPGALPPRDHVEAVLAAIGIRPDTHLLIYDDEGGGWAGRLAWVLDTVGMPHYSLLDGGLHAWHAAGYPLDDTPHRTPCARHDWSWPDTATIDKARLLTSLGDPDVVIWDARSHDEYTGARQTALQRGHIPGAVQYEWTRAMDHGRALRLRDLATIADELSQRGIRGDRHVITHCHSHHRSGFTYFLGKLLGFTRLQAYAGSWAEWGNDPETPTISGEQPR